MFFSKHFILLEEVKAKKLLIGFSFTQLLICQPHTHTHTYIFIYIYICVCVCVWVWVCVWMFVSCYARNISANVCPHFEEYEICSIFLLLCDWPNDPHKLLRLFPVCDSLICFYALISEFWPLAKRTSRNIYRFFGAVFFFFCHATRSLDLLLCVFFKYKQLYLLWPLNIFTLTLHCPVDSGSRIHRLYLCWGVRPPNECPGYDTKQSDDKASVTLLLEMRSSPSLPSFSGQHRPTEVESERVYL